MNKNKHYLISDASRQVQVEAHVLRYWEDELGLPIPRNELGHRYYTEFHIQLFRQIKQLKEQGYQLKAIRGILGKVEENQKTEPEALLEVLGEAETRAKKLAESDEYGFIAAADANAENVVHSLYDNIVDGRKVVVDFK